MIIFSNKSFEQIFVVSSIHLIMTNRTLRKYDKLIIKINSRPLVWKKPQKCREEYFVIFEIKYTYNNFLEYNVDSF